MESFGHLKQSEVFSYSICKHGHSENKDYEPGQDENQLQLKVPAKNDGFESNEKLLN